MTLGELISGGGRAALDKLAAAGSMIRYGVPFNQKAVMALSGQIPGAQRENLRSGLGSEIEERRAAAYLFGKQWPNLGPEAQPFVDRLRRFAGDDPRLLAVTQQAVEQGAAERERADAAARARMPQVPAWILEAK